MVDWYKLDAQEVLEKLGSNLTQGLTEAEANKRLAESGPNELIEKPKNPWAMLWEQLTGSMVLILIAAAVASAVLGDLKDCLAILAIVVFNAILGLRQEYKADKAIAALKRMSVPTVKVRRSGHVLEIGANEIVVGDMLLLEAGNSIPADGRIIESANLRVQEAALTGESVPVEKNSQKLAGDNLALGDRRNMVYMATLVTYGRGQVLITETAMRTELGKIANMIQEVEEEQTPLQRRLDQLGKAVTLGALVIIAIVVGIGLVRGGFSMKNIEFMLMTGISLVVAAVPEGLAAVVTITLALGAQRMLKRHALIRKLPAVETLGSVTVICSDKTGTLTENRMTVTTLQMPGQNMIDINQHVRHSRRIVRSGSRQSQILQEQPGVSVMMAVASLCNDAVLESESEDAEDVKTVGDPTEVALVVFAARLGLWKSQMEKFFPRVTEVPFDSERKRMTTVHRPDIANQSLEMKIPPAFGPFVRALKAVKVTPYVAFTKGAVDSILQICDKVWLDGQIEPMSKWADQIAKHNDAMAQNGLRVMGCAFRLLKELPGQEQLKAVEDKMYFIGMVGMLDPARHEVKDAVATCKAAGVRPVMITGDHPLTAQNIAATLGITNNNKVLTGSELEQMPVEELQQRVTDVSVFARVSPEHKLKIVDAFQKRGEIVAMTGDGVNDAPALKKANIGVAMGLSGTDAAKEAAAMVLEDDNFATIVSAVEEGRVIYEGARRFVKYLMSCNSGAIWLMLLGAFFIVSPDPAVVWLPLLPIQILWINLMGDGLSALALGVEKPDRNIMQQPPYLPSESIFSRGLGVHMLWAGIVIGLVPFFLALYLCSRYPYAQWQTMIFTTFIMSRMCHAMAIRSQKESLFTIGFFSNKALVGAVLLTFLCQLCFIYLEPCQKVLGTTYLTAMQLVVCLAISTTIFWAVEIEKFLLRRRKVALK